MTRPPTLPPPTNEVLEGDDARVAALVRQVTHGFATTGGPRPLLIRYIDVEELVRFVLLRAEGPAHV